MFPHRFVSALNGIGRIDIAADARREHCRKIERGRQHADDREGRSLQRHACGRRCSGSEAKRVRHNGSLSITARGPFHNDSSAVNDRPSAGCTPRNAKKFCATRTLLRRVAAVPPAFPPLLAPLLTAGVLSFHSPTPLSVMSSAVPKES